ncbi:MAG: hypothetical protein ACMUJM_04715 [bacterium]
MSNMHTITKEYATASEERESVFLIESIIYGRKDWEWERYVSKLDAGDVNGAFLLPHELPSSSSTPQEIRDAITTGSRRAFKLGSKFRISNYILGKLRGKMRILLPQGKEYSFYFNDEPGWRARITLKDKESFFAYYRSKCMNPLREAIVQGGEVDSSRLEFIPVGEKKAQRVAPHPLLNQIIENNLLRLRHQYKRLKSAS